MRIIVDSNKDVEELRDEVSRCVDAFVELYRKIVDKDLVVTVKVED